MVQCSIVAYSDMVHCCITELQMFRQSVSTNCQQNCTAVYSDIVQFCIMELQMFRQTVTQYKLSNELCCCNFTVIISSSFHIRRVLYCWSADVQFALCKLYCTLPQCSIIMAFVQKRFKGKSLFLLYTEK
jgi:hypothetical protein